jgi:hypothetical protein
VSEKRQKVEIIIKDSFETKLLHPYLEDDRGGINLTGGSNSAFLSIVIGQHGKPVIAYITEDMQLAVNGESHGYDGMVMIGFEFIEMDQITPIGCPYIKGRMYQMADQDNKIGVYVGMEFDSKSKEVIYILVGSDRKQIRGNTMVELSDEDLDLFGLDERTEYYSN